MKPEQTDLFNLPVQQLHRPGQATSKAALEKTVKQRTALHQRVHKRLLDFGAAGAIPEELAVIMPAELIDVRRAFSVLKKLGKIVATGRTRPNERGNECEVWRAA